MKYKIVSVKHSGRDYTRGVDRVDFDYPTMIGKEINVNFAQLKKGFPWKVEYCKFAYGSFTTSRVIGIQETFLRLTVETEDTIYELEKVIGQEV